MKRMMSMLLILVLILGMFSLTVFAKDPIISPEQGNVDVEPSQPSSPQTGGLPAVVYVAAAVLLCGVAVICIRKAVA